MYQDRDSFRTINSASAVPPTASLTQHGKENLHSRLDQASCLTAAKAISGSYRRDEAHDPETFVAALAIIFGDYPASIVQYAADPRTGRRLQVSDGLAECWTDQGVLRRNL